MSKSESEKKLSISKNIPTRRIILNDISQLPTEYSSTPGGTFFSTTPGGTRIVYERAFLMQCRNSPLAKSPPANMLHIPGVTSPALSDLAQENGDTAHIQEEHDKGKLSAEDAQFQMDI